jgi:DNA modification methylase
MVELTLYNGDCLEIMKGLPEKSVDLIICDLPYGCLVTPLYFFSVTQAAKKS